MVVEKNQLKGVAMAARKKTSKAQTTASKSKSMTKSALINHLAESNEMTRKEVVTFMDSLLNTAYKEARNGFTLPGIGKLVLVNRKARMGRNPATGESIKIPAKKVVKFRIAKAAKDAILPGKK
jgi:DNA-binding protein HU-beta